MYEAEVIKAQAILGRFSEPPVLLVSTQSRELLTFADTVCCVLVVTAREDMRGKYSGALEESQRKDVFVQVRVMANLAMWVAGQVGFVPNRRIWQSPTSTVQILADCSQAQHIVSTVAGSHELATPPESAVALTLTVLETFVAMGPIFAQVPYQPHEDEYYFSNPPQLDAIDRLLWSSIE